MISQQVSFFLKILFTKILLTHPIPFHRDKDRPSYFPENPAAIVQDKDPFFGNFIILQ
jgi:hypothetical protein